MEQNYLPGNIHERLEDLMKSHKITQTELAERIGSTESTLNRFISGKTNKLSNENIVRIAKFFGVSTDFLLGVVKEPDRKNYDISELGLSVQAAKNLYSGNVNTDVLNLLLTNQRFADVTYLIARYLNNNLAKGVAGMNSVFNVAGAYLAGKAKEEHDPAIMQGAREARLLKTPVYQADVTTIQTMFMQAVSEIKKEHGADAAEIKNAQALTKELTQKLLAEAAKGQDKPDVSITPEALADAIMGTVASSDMISPEALADLKKAYIGIMNSMAEKAKENGSADE